MTRLANCAISCSCVTITSVNARRTATFLAEQATPGLAAKVKAFDLVEFFGEVLVVEAGVFRAGQAQEGLAGARGQATVAGPAAVGVKRSLAEVPSDST